MQLFARNSRKIEWLTLLIAIGVLCAWSAGAEHETSEYQLPLIGNYAINRTTEDYFEPKLGWYQLGETSGPHKSVSYLVTDLKQVAVSGNMIVGTQGEGYFVLDASRPYGEPRLFSNIDQWKAALAEAGVPAAIELKSPDSLAAGLSDLQIHPFNYRTMGARFGWSDDRWSSNILLAGLILMFVHGIFTRSRSLTFSVAVVLGVFSNYFILLVIADAGPGAFSSFIVTPVFYCMADGAGRRSRRFFRERQKKLE